MKPKQIEAFPQIHGFNLNSPGPLETDSNYLDIKAKEWLNVGHTENLRRRAKTPLTPQDLAGAKNVMEALCHNVTGRVGNPLYEC